VGVLTSLTAGPSGLPGVTEPAATSEQNNPSLLEKRHPQM
jgi:hypothetical protein